MESNTDNADILRRAAKVIEAADCLIALRCKSLTEQMAQIVSEMKAAEQKNEDVSSLSQKRAVLLKTKMNLQSATGKQALYMELLDAYFEGEKLY